MNPVFDPLQRRMVSGPEAGQNVDVDGFEVSFTGSTTGGVYNAAAGLTLTGNTFSVAPGYRMNTSSGMVNQDRYFDIETVDVSGASPSVTMLAGHAYSINATSSKGILLNVESFSTSKFGLEGHLQIFTANQGYVRAGANVFLKEALEPDSINNCTVRFHGGSATISVEDHLGGYIVISGGTSVDSGSLPYGLASAASSYIAFSDIPELTGVPINMGGVVTNGEKHVVGNGYADTILTGGISCTSQTTFANLAMSNVVNSGGRMTLGDVYIPFGSTVSGALNTEKVILEQDGGSTHFVSGGYFGGIGNGEINMSVYAGNIFLNAPSSIISDGAIVRSTLDKKRSIAIGNETRSVTFTDFSGYTNAGYGCFVIDNKTCSLNGCVFTHNVGGNQGIIWVRSLNPSEAKVYVTGCTFSNNSDKLDSIPYANNAINLITNASATITDSYFDGYSNINLTSANTSVSFAGSNFVGRMVTGSGSVTFTSGAILDLTGNSNATPINPGGGVTFAPGGETVYPSAGSASAYMLGGMTVPQIGNTNVVKLGGTNVVISSGTTASASGCTFSGGSAANGGFVLLESASLHAYNCVISGNEAETNGGAVYVGRSASFEASSCTISGNIAPGRGPDVFTRYGTAKLIDCTLGAIAPGEGNLTIGGSCTVEQVVSGLTGNLVIDSGAIVDLTGNTNATPINPGGGVTFGANVTVINSAGSSVLLNDGVAGSCTQINNDGTTE